MARAVEPRRHHLVDRGLAGSDVFTGSAPVITGIGNALAERAAVKAGMRKVIILSHVSRVAGGSIEQLVIPLQSRRGCVGERTASPCSGANLVNPGH